MKHNAQSFARALPIMSAAALLAIPAHAQEATQTAPPPVRPTVSTPAPAVPPAAVVTTPAPVTPAPAAPTRPRATIAPEAQAALDEEAARQERAAAERAERPERRERAAAAPPARRPAPRRAEAAAPVAEPAPAAPAVASAGQASAPAEQAAPTPPPASQPAAEPATPADTTTTATETTQTQEQRGGSIWPWLIGAVIVLGGLAFLLFRRREREDEIYDETYEEPRVAQPVIATEPKPFVAEPAVAAYAAGAAPLPAGESVAPSTPEEVSVGAAETEDVAALIAAAPAADRPWIEMAMRPLRAGTSADEALVEIELTIANAGTIAAEDVRVSTFMLPDADAGEMERLLISPPADAAVAPVTIAPGEGTRIEATLARLRAEFGAAERFRPIVVADARYRLPDGSEGRTSASFVIGVSGADGELQAFDLADRRMHDDVEARLHGPAEHV